MKQAEGILLEEQSSKGYLGIVGDLDYDAIVPKLLLGTNHPLIESGRVTTVQSPGGTGALRVAADLIATTFPKSKVWLSEPTWPNHPNIFKAAGVETDQYAYYDLSLIHI